MKMLYDMDKNTTLAEFEPEFLPIGDRLVELSYPTDMALTVLSMIKIYLVFRAIMW
jgi:hypothetical protein